MRSDVELLELAAKAHGSCKYFNNAWRCDDTGYREFNPLVDDGDAFRLMVKLHIQVASDGRTVIAMTKDYQVSVPEISEAYGVRTPAARRAIVRAAAEIGAKQ